MSEDTEYALCGVNAVISIRKFCNILRCKNCEWCPLENYKNANTRMEHFTYEDQFHIVMQDIRKFCDIVFFIAVGAITTHSLIKDIKSLKQIRKLISELIDNDDGDLHDYSEVEA